MAPTVQFVTARDGTRIAYCTHGTGPPLVFVRGWISHLELMWHDHAFHAFVEALAQNFTVVRYDARGNGLSEWNVADFNLDGLISDLEAVTGQLRADRFTLYGQCFGGPIAIAYEAKHPERVEKLILDGTYACGPRITSPARREKLMTTLRDLPEAGLLLMSYYTHPDPSQPRFRQLDSPHAIAPHNAARLYHLGFEMDVTPMLSAIETPTLVMHRTDTRAIPIRLGRELASSIADARFVALPGIAHNSWEGDPLPTIAALGEFLGVPLAIAAPAAAAPLQVILFTDVVGSTALGQRLGDARTQQLMRVHDAVVRDAVKTYGGTEIKHTGDGVFAAFSSASRALECAISIQRRIGAAEALKTDPPLRVRIGLNAGEPIAVDADLFGSAVNLAARICAHAASEQILVPQVMRYLVAGKDFSFVDVGEATLKGFEGTVRLSELRWQQEE